MDSQSNPPCPLCGEQSPGPPVSLVGGYTLRSCAACDLVFADPMTAADRDWYENPVCSDRGIQAREEDIFLHRKLRAKQRWELPYNHLAYLRHPLHKGGRMLDIGCGEGALLRFARPLYAEVAGIDFDRDAIEAAGRLYGIDRAYAQTLEEFQSAFPDDRFDVIVLFEILEHVEDPPAFLEQVKRSLAPGGMLAISVPNRERAGAQEDPLDQPPVHLTKWTPTGLERFLSVHGFRVTDISRRKTHWSARSAHRWLLPVRLSPVLEPLLSRARKHETIVFRERTFETARDTTLTATVTRAVALASELLWYPLWPVYRFLGQPSYGIYAEAVLEP